LPAKCSISFSLLLLGKILRHLPLNLALDLVQVVGMRVRVTPAVPGTPAADPVLPSRLVLIGRRGALDAEAIHAATGLRPLVHAAAGLRPLDMPQD
jgi:hypothetical protein